MRVKLLVTVAALATAVVPTSGSVSADPPFVNHFKGRAAQTILTDCKLNAADGTECSGVDIFVSDERYQERGSLFPLSIVFVTVFDVVIDSSAPLGFVPTLAAVGSSTDAEVSVARNLASASVIASQIDLTACTEVGEEVICGEEGGTMSLDVAWSATGRRQTNTFHARGNDGSFYYNFRAVDAFRPATASGEVDGRPFSETAFFPSSIFATNNGVIERTTG